MKQLELIVQEGYDYKQTFPHLEKRAHFNIKVVVVNNDNLIYTITDDNFECVNFCKKDGQWKNIKIFDVKILNPMDAVNYIVNPKEYGWVVDAQKDFDLFENKDFDIFEGYYHKLFDYILDDNLDGVKEELLKGVDINMRAGDYDKDTPLLLACGDCNYKIAKYLIDNNADLFIKNTGGEDVLSKTFRYAYGKKLNTEKIIVNNDCLKIIEYALDKILKKEPYKAYEFIKYMNKKQKEKYKEFITLSKDFDIDFELFED